MNRRDFVRAILTGLAASYEIDVDKIMWVPGAKTIFIPSPNHGLTEAQIVAMELERMIPHLKDLFERDDVFYRQIENHRKIEVSSRPMNVPIIFTDMEKK
jgi:hypothetical protein